MAAPTFKAETTFETLCRDGHRPPAFCLGGNKTKKWAFSLPPPFGHLPHQREASTSLSSCGGFQGIRIRPLHSVQGDSIKGRDAGGEGRCGHRPLQGAGRSLPSPEGKAPLPALRATFPRGEGLSAGRGASRDGRGLSIAEGTIILNSRRVRFSPAIVFDAILMRM